MVDWSLARQLARFAANVGAAPPPLPDTDFAPLVAESERHLTEYTGLSPIGGIPMPETVERAECGLVLGYMSQRVLGQYELALLEPERPARLLFVGPNLARAVRDLDIDSDSFLRWIVLHEVTHVLQFTGVPWLREHMGGLMREYLA